MRWTEAGDGIGVDDLCIGSRFTRFSTFTTQPNQIDYFYFDTCATFFFATTVATINRASKQAMHQ